MKKVFLIFCLGLLAQAQTPQLSLDRVVGKAGQTVRLPLSISGISGKGITGIQWVLVYDSRVISVNQTTGEVATTSGKAFLCNTVEGHLTMTKCLLLGNDNVLSDGVLTNLDITLLSRFSGTTGVEAIGAVGTDPDADTFFIESASGVVSDGKTQSPQAKRVRVSAGVASSGHEIRCGKVITTLRAVGDKLECISNIPTEEKGSWYRTFTSREDLVKATPEAVFVDSGESAFKFEVTLIANPQITKESILLVGAGKDGSKTTFGVINLMPKGAK